MARSLVHCIGLLSFLAALHLHGSTGLLEVQGQIEVLKFPVHVQIYGTDSPFTAFTTSNSHGQFHFRRLKPGTYVVSAFFRRRGEVHRTVVVTSSLADPKGVVRVTIPLPPAAATLDRVRRRSTVSVGQLSISEAARQKYAEAQKALTRRDTDRAIGHLNKAVQLAPKFTDAWNSLGVIAYQTQNFSKAELYFRKALEVDPGNWTPTVNLGGVLLNLNRPADALEYNRYAAQLRPNDALANSQLGLTYFHLGDLENAEKYLRTAEGIDPSHFSHPQLTLAEIYARRGDKSATLRELHDFLDRFPDSPLSAELRRKLDLFEKNKEPAASP